MKNNLLLFFCLLIPGCFKVAAQNRQDSVFQKFERFSGSVNTKAAAGVRVNIFNQAIGERQNRKALATPFPGLMIVQLKAGDLRTVINGVARERREGEFWVVPAHETMQVLTGDDVASVQVIVINEDPAASAKLKAAARATDTALAKTYTSYMPGVIRRKVFTAVAPSSFHVEIWDMMAALGKKLEKISFPGAAVFEVMTGSASFTVEGKRYEMRMGSTLFLNEGSTLEIDTQKSQDPFHFRATVITNRK
jgi:hypothetical protein